MKLFFKQIKKESGAVKSLGSLSCLGDFRMKTLALQSSQKNVYHSSTVDAIIIIIFLFRTHIFIKGKGKLTNLTE